MKCIDKECNGNVCCIRLKKNVISTELLNELDQIIDYCEKSAVALIITGDKKIFCQGADFDELTGKSLDSYNSSDTADKFYDTFNKLASGSFVSILVVEGKISAGGLAFVGACDIVISGIDATFIMSELLFGLCPACILPFLLRKTSKATLGTMALTALGISAEKAEKIGLSTYCTDNTDKMLKNVISRIKLMSKDAIRNYKRYADSLTEHASIREKAINENKRMYSDPEVIKNIIKFKEKGLFPWQ